MVNGMNLMIELSVNLMSKTCPTKPLEGKKKSKFKILGETAQKLKKKIVMHIYYSIKEILCLMKMGLFLNLDLYFCKIIIKYKINKKLNFYFN